MATQLVKKKFGGKRKGYRGKKSKPGLFSLKNKWSYLNPLSLQGWGTHKFGINEMIDALTPFSGFLPLKAGGRVKGVGKATHGYGKAMRKK